MNNWKVLLIRFGLLLLAIALSLLITKWWFTFIIGSDLPNWLKFALLRG